MGADCGGAGCCSNPERTQFGKSNVDAQGRSRMRGGMSPNRGTPHGITKNAAEQKARPQVQQVGGKAGKKVTYQDEQTPSFSTADQDKFDDSSEGRRGTHLHINDEDD